MANGNCILNSATVIACPASEVVDSSAQSFGSLSLTVGAIVGIAVGALVGVVLIVLVIVFVVRRKTIEELV